MKEFSNEIENKIDNFLSESSEYYEKGNIIKSGNYLVKAYKIIPQPREKYNESYNYCSYVLDYILDEEYEVNNALKWLQELELIANFQKTWEGSYEFYAAKTYFVIGQFEKAIEYFDKCIEIGKGMRYFEDEDPKYKDFYLNPEKYTNE